MGCYFWVKLYDIALKLIVSYDVIRLSKVMNSEVEEDLNCTSLVNMDQIIRMKGLWHSIKIEKAFSIGILFHLSSS